MLLLGASVLVAPSCAGTSTQQVSGPAETTTTAARTSSTTTPPDCASTLPSTAQASQLLMVMVPDPSNAKQPLTDGLVGGFGLKGEQRSDVSDAITEATADVPIAATVAVDEEGGSVQRLRYSAGRLPSAQEMGDMSIAKVTSLSAEHAKRMAEIGVTMNFAPVADLQNDAVLEGRTFSDDPDTVGKYAAAVAKGNAEGGVVPVVKHWPGIGGADSDPHESLPVLAPLDQLESSDLKAFAPTLADGSSAVMVAHAEVPGLTDAGEPASLSRNAITGELRGREGFKGVVITDSLGMGAIVNKMTQADAAVQAITAGADIALLSGTDVINDAHDQLQTAIEDGDIPTEQIEGSVRRVLAMKGIEGECFDAISAFEASSAESTGDGNQAGEADPGTTADGQTDTSGDQTGGQGPSDSGINDPN